MGYTHYWTHKRQLTRTEWSEFSQGVLDLLAHCAETGVRLVREYDEPGKPPELDRENLIFNGVGEDGHETFLICRTREPAWNDDPKRRGWGFCKTARKPYDIAVTAILAYLDSVHPEKFEASSDGCTKDWDAGVKLARKCWPNKANMIDTPRGVKETDRYARYPDGSKQHVLAVGHDDRYYLERRSDKWRIALPWDDDDHKLWVQSLPANQRKYGSFAGGESDACATRRLNALWINFSEHAEPPAFFSPLAA